MAPLMGLTLCSTDVVAERGIMIILIPSPQADEPQSIIVL